MFKRLCWKPIYSQVDLLIFGIMCYFGGVIHTPNPPLLTCVLVSLFGVIWICISAFKTHKYYKVTEKE